MLKKELVGPLRSRRRMQRVKHASTAGQRCGQIFDGLSSHDPPADVEDPAIPVIGKGSDHRLTEYAYSHFGRTSVALHPAEEGAGERHHQRGDNT
jgi:hypothetical protein